MKKITNPYSFVLKKLAKFSLPIIIILAVAISLIYFKKNSSNPANQSQQSNEISGSESETSSKTVNNTEESKQELSQTQENQKGGGAKIITNNPLLKILPSDHYLGSENAPILFIEYASLSCPHCANFTKEAFEQLKSQYIDSGKVRYVYRDFPLNHPALAGAVIAKCRAQQESSKEKAAEKFYETVKILFRTQDNWAFDPQNFINKMQTILKLDGMDEQNFSSCLDKKEIQEEILKNRIEAAKLLALKSTPTFYINGEQIDGYVDFKSIAKVIDLHLAGKVSK